MRDNDAAGSSASAHIQIGFDAMMAKSDAETKRPTQASHGVMTDEIIALTEKVFPRLPENGGVILIGSLTAQDDSPSLALGFAQALQLISAKPVLMIRFDSDEGSGKASLAEILRRHATLEEAVQNDPRTLLKTLSASIQTTEAGAILMSPAFRDLLQNAQKAYPWIVLHYPALIHREETISLISRSNAVIATMRKGEGRGYDVQALRQLCIQLKTNFLGVALT